MSLTKATFSMISGAFINVLDEGADRTGVVSSQSAIQSAINKADAAGGGVVYFPSGTYLIDSITAGKSKVALVGEGMYASQIIQAASMTVRMLDWNSQSSDPANNLVGIHISDLGFSSNIAAFSLGYEHLLAFYGVSDVVIERCLFQSFRGDGVYVADYSFGGTVGSRTNTNVTIRDCVFDGVDYENRNGISLLDCDGALISNNTFLRCSRQDMPGPIDCEPDHNASVLKNITIEYNKFESYKSTRAITCWFSSAPLNTKPENIKIIGNEIKPHGGASFSASIRINFVQDVAASDPMGIVIADNVMENFAINGVRGVVIKNNTMLNGTISDIGTITTATLTARDVLVEGNNFYKSSNSNGCLELATVTNIKIRGNTFLPKDTSGDKAINLFGSGVTTVSNNVEISGNTFVQASGVAYIFTVQNDGSNTMNSPLQNVYSNNTNIGSGSFLNNFDWRKGDVRYFAAAPTTGAWTVGQYVLNSAPAAGQPQGWVCTVAGTSGTWKAMANLV